jgi:hypothetical protein
LSSYSTTIHDHWVDVVTQRVRTSWTTLSRGGPAAARRNAAPVGFVLPEVVAPLAHEVVMRDHTGQNKNRVCTVQGPSVEVSPVRERVIR